MGGCLAATCRNPIIARLLIFHRNAGQGRAGSTPPCGRRSRRPLGPVLAMLGAEEAPARGSGPPCAEVEPSRSPAFPLPISNRLMQKGNSAMTELSNGIIVTDLHAHDDNLALSQRGYSIRHIETWHEQDNQTFIHWDAPELTEADLPF
jgi:hypothetical protein